MTPVNHHQREREKRQRWRASSGGGPGSDRCHTWRPWFTPGHGREKGEIERIDRNEGLESASPLAMAELAAMWLDGGHGSGGGSAGRPFVPERERKRREFEREKEQEGSVGASDADGRRDQGR